MKCYICGAHSSENYGQRSMCDKHNRFKQMQHTAKQDKKYVPAFVELERLCNSKMICPDCGDQMHWIDNDNRSKGAVLQHYRDGSLGIVCTSCNIKHGALPGDMYKSIPSGHKLCVACRSIKPLAEFYVRRDSKKEYPMSKCKACNHQAHIEWRAKNPMKYKEANKRNNDKRAVKNGQQ